MLQGKDLSSEKIEKIAQETGTFQTLQKMRNGKSVLHQRIELL